MNTATPLPPAADLPPAPPAGAVAVPVSPRVLIAHRPRLGLRETLKVIGPGIITGGADNDPAGITTYSVVGAQNGYSRAFPNSNYSLL